MLNSIFCIALIFFSYSLKGQHPIINEFMIKNDTTIVDQFGEFSDWIELFNPSENNINLKNYHLTDDEDELSKWTFPDIIIPSKKFLLIFASKEDRIDTNELHTNFKLSGKDNHLILTDSANNIINKISIYDIGSDISQGRIADNHPSWDTIYNPTPGQSNLPTPEISISHPQGFYSEEFFLKISSSDSIFYTLDGTEPTPNSLAFVDSLLISDISYRDNTISMIPTTPHNSSFANWKPPKGKVDKALIIRFATFNNNLRSSQIFSNIYFIHSKKAAKYDLPIVSIITNPSNLFDDTNGIYVPGVHFDPNDASWSGNYYQRGKEWEREIELTYFDKSGNENFSQKAGLRIHGNYTRKAAQKSLRLYARKEYGSKYFNHKIFPDQNTTKYKRLILQTTMGEDTHGTMLKDILAQSMSKPLKFDKQNYKPVVVFINGEYWGIHSIRDRIDEYFIGLKHQIDPDSIEIIEVANFGYHDDYYEMDKFVIENDLSIPANYDEISKRIDIKSYIDYYIAQMFFTNYDWPGNNVKIWKRKDSKKWHWIMFDMDVGFQNVSLNMFEHATRTEPTPIWPNPAKATLIFRKLLKNEQFKNSFISRHKEILENEFSSKNGINQLENIKNGIDSEIFNHQKRWHTPNEIGDWEYKIDERLAYYITNRPCIVAKQLKAFFNLDSFDYECEYDSDEHQQFIIFPNPTTGQINLINTKGEIKNGEILLTNSSGQIIFHQKDYEHYEHAFKTFNLPENLIKGYYFLTIKSDKTINHLKILLQQ